MMTNLKKNKKKILKAMDLMIYALVKGKYATKEKAELIRAKLLEVPEERMVGVDLRNKKDVEQFILQEIPEWSEEWLLN